MGFFKNFFSDNNAVQAKAKARDDFKVTDNVVRRYCRKRQRIEDGINRKDASFKQLENNIKSKGYDVDQLYDDFLAEREFIPEDDQEYLDDAEDIYEGEDEIKEEVRHVVVQQGVPFVKEREVDRTNPDGTVERIKEISVPVAACGRKLSSEADVAGFCSVCGKGVCSDHVEYCSGYGSSRCKKLLCPDHTYYFTDYDDTSYPCCEQHYYMRENFQEAPAFKFPSNNKPVIPEDG